MDRFSCSKMVGGVLVDGCLGSPFVQKNNLKTRLNQEIRAIQSPS